jgi:preprotein translocase subunit Sec63
MKMEKQKYNISCKNITLDVFIDCDINGNLRRLSETATNEELQEIWDDICSEYARITGNNSLSYAFSVTKRVYLLETKLVSAMYCLKFPSENTLILLNKIGYKGNDFGKITARIQRETIELESAKKELDKLMKTEKNRATEDDYVKWIVSVSKYMGYHIDRNKIMVSEFLEMSRQMENSYKNKKSK